MKLTLTQFDTILFALLVSVVLIEFYWTYLDRQAGSTGAGKGVL